MSASVTPTSFAPFDRPIRAAFIGLGRVYDLNVRGYVDNDDVEVVAIVDPSGQQRAKRQSDWPAADGSSGITSSKAMDDAEAAGRAIEVGSNFFLFFKSRLSAHAGH